MPLSRRARARAILLSRSLLLVNVFADENFQEAAHFAMLLGLRIDPVADHLLLAAHVMHQALDRFREIGHGGRGGAVRPALANCLSQALDGCAQVARGGAGGGPDRGIAAPAESAHGGGG